MFQSWKIHFFFLPVSPEIRQISSGTCCFLITLPRCVKLELAIGKSVGLYWFTRGDSLGSGCSLCLAPKAVMNIYDDGFFFSWFRKLLSVLVGCRLKVLCVRSNLNFFNQYSLRHFVFLTPPWYCSWAWREQFGLASVAYLPAYSPEAAVGDILLVSLTSTCPFCALRWLPGGKESILLNKAVYSDCCSHALPCCVVTVPQ